MVVGISFAGVGGVAFMLLVLFVDFVGKVPRLVTPAPAVRSGVGLAGGAALLGMAYGATRGVGVNVVALDFVPGVTVVEDFIAAFGVVLDPVLLGVRRLAIGSAVGCGCVPFWSILRPYWPCSPEFK